MIQRLRTSATIGSLGLALALSAAPIDVRAEPAGIQATAFGVDPRDGRAKLTRTCQGVRATIVGNRKGNLLIGTPRRDVIWAGLGADTVLGRGGRDLICGGRGADALIGGAGRDKLYGQRQRDYCHGERREHRHHYRCDVHFNDLGEEVDPPTASRPAGLATSLAPRAPTVARRAAAYVGMDAPLCNVTGQALMDVHLGKVYFQAQYTNPGWIAVLPYYYRWGNSGFVDGPYYPSNWLQYNAPLDGQAYSADMFATHVPKSDGRIIVMYAVYWWDGAQWVDGTTLQVYRHYLQTTAGPLFTGGVCGH